MGFSIVSWTCMSPQTFSTLDLMLQAMPSQRAADQRKAWKMTHAAHQHIITAAHQGCQPSEESWLHHTHWRPCRRGGKQQQWGIVPWITWAAPPWGRTLLWHRACTHDDQAKSYKQERFRVSSGHIRWPSWQPPDPCRLRMEVDSITIVSF